MVLKDKNLPLKNLIFLQMDNNLFEFVNLFLNTCTYDYKYPISLNMLCSLWIEWTHISECFLNLCVYQWAENTAKGDNHCMAGADVINNF